MGGGQQGPPNKWNVKVPSGSLSSDEFLELLNDQANKGNVNVVVKSCTDGEFAFFGNYGAE